MDNKSLIGHIERLVDTARSVGQDDFAALGAAKAQVLAFLGTYAGERSPFYDLIIEATGGGTAQVSSKVVAALNGFKAHVESGLLNEISPARQAQIDVVSDFLSQAQFLIGSNAIHPAAPIILIGASLEEFLRNWIDSLALEVAGKNPSIEAYSQVLSAAGKITKVDVKDISAWAALRNQAAHGQFDEVSERKRASLMLEGVNLFMRRYGAS